MNSSRHDYSTACRCHRRLVLLLLTLGTACGALVVLLLPLALNVSNADAVVSDQFLNSENSNTNKNRIIAAAAATINDDARRNMVGGYSSTLDVDLPEIKNVANFVLEELLAMMMSSQTSITRGETTKETTTVVTTTTTLDNIIIRKIIEAQRQNSNNTIKVEVLRAQRQVVAGMNYKLTLAIITNNTSSNDSSSNEEHDNSNNEEHDTITSSCCCCVGGIENIIIYRPLPHTGSSYDVVSWGTVLTCDTVLTMMGRTKET